MEGVCCECQTVQGVYRSPQTNEWIMDAHDAFCVFCQGSGTAPQALLDPDPKMEKYWDLLEDEMDRDSLRRGFVNY